LIKKIAYLKKININSVDDDGENRLPGNNNLKKIILPGRGMSADAIIKPVKPPPGDDEKKSRQDTQQKRGPGSGEFGFTGWLIGGINQESDNII
jgi:hypothetical protein